MFQKMLSTQRGHRLSLLWQLAKRDIASRYRGSVLGIIWSLMTPLIMLSIYGFVFSVVFKARWGQATGAKGEFALILFSGLMVHTFFNECLVRAPTLIFSNPNFVKKVVFPLELLAPATMLSALFHFFVASIVFWAASILILGGIKFTILLLPLMMVPFMILTLGVMWFLAAFGVYFRDIAQLMGLAGTVLLFMSPILFPSTMLPEAIRGLIYLNPLSFIVEQVRDVALWGKMPHWAGLGIYTVVASIIYIMGYWMFQKLKKGFADVI